jgi:hypothetical protein
MKKTEVRAVEMVRRIRDEQAAFLAGRTQAEVLDYFHKAGEAALADVRKRAATAAPKQQGR